jgi:hypothetical protein
MVVRWDPGARVAVTWDLGEVAVFLHIATNLLKRSVVRPRCTCGCEVALAW